ncbi:MAG TPA: glycine--tRNA ligase subunit beta, partial [Vicinamibacteria bacterium]
MGRPNGKAPLPSSSQASQLMRLGKARARRVAASTPGRDAREVLPGVIAQVLRGLAFPKRMSWDAWLDDGKGVFPFGRPIRWLAALLAG